VSIRLRLTLLYSVILALTLIVFSAVLYVLQARYTLNILERDLSQAANGLAMLARARLNMLQERWPANPDGPRADRGGQPWPQLRDLRTRDTVRLLAPDGSILELGVNEQGVDLPLSQEGLERLLQGQTWTEIVPGEEGRWLVYSQPVNVGGEVVGIAQAARPLADRDRSLQALGMALILGSLLITVVAFGAGWAMAGVTLRPIHRITETALEIGRARDFSQRVQYQGPNDELGQLATTLNGMLHRLQDAYQQIAHALQVQRDFVADVSHELRTPLTTIRGNLALLRRVPALPHGEREDVLDDLTGESERLIRLVSDLLTLARADAGRKFKGEPVEVRPVVEDVCRQAQVLDPERTIEYDGLDDAVALADHDALKQVLLTLIDNAVKHGKGPIHVALDETDDRVTIRVQDSGPGMPPGLRERVFDRFYRGDESRSSPGFGLGLSIARALIEAQQGTITVDSEVGEGSTFTVTLPRAHQRP
jgi:two-component system OmpR family sensor kinase